jgi:hypothetical protein
VAAAVAEAGGRAGHWRSIAVQVRLSPLARIADWADYGRMDIGKPDTEREIEVIPVEEPLPRTAPVPVEEPLEEPVPA